MPYTRITLHAVSKDRTLFAEDCIYVMIDSHVEMPGANHTHREPPQEIIENDDSDVESEADISELILIPENKALINVLYEKISECQVRCVLRASSNLFFNFNCFWHIKLCFLVACYNRFSFKKVVHLTNCRIMVMYLSLFRLIVIYKFHSWSNDFTL